MADINIVIKMFFNYVKPKNSLLSRLLQDGLAGVEIDGITQKSGINLTPDLYALFGFKNGFKEDVHLAFEQKLLFDNGYFLPIEKALRDYEAIKHLSSLHLKLPIFDSGGGDFLLMDCDTKSNTYNRILFYSPAILIIKPVTIYDSLTNLFLTSLRCFAQGIYEYDKQGYLKIATDKQWKVCRELNPLSEFWI